MAMDLEFELAGDRSTIVKECENQRGPRLSCCSLTFNSPPRSLPTKLDRAKPRGIVKPLDRRFDTVSGGSLSHASRGALFSTMIQRGCFNLGRVNFRPRLCETLNRLDVGTFRTAESLPEGLNVDGLFDYFGWTSRRIALRAHSRVA